MAIPATRRGPKRSASQPPTGAATTIPSEAAPHTSPPSACAIDSSAAMLAMSGGRSDQPRPPPTPCTAAHSAVVSPGLSLAAATIDGSSEWLEKSVEAGEQLGASTRQAVKETAAQAGQPLAPLVETFGAFHKFAEEHAARLAAYADQATKLDAGARVTEAFDEYARLLKDSLRYGSQMAAAWRKLAVEAAKRTAESITPAV